MSNVNQIEQAVVELRDWAADTGQQLPYDAETLALEETLGVAFDLTTGEVDAIAINEEAWLAALEEAAGGSVSVAWAMRPEEYFAMVEGGRHVAGQ